VRVVTCIKQVPDTQEIKMDPERGTLIRKGVPAIINPFDLHAIEEGLQLVEKFGGEVVVLSMGPPMAEDAVREAISMGCQDGVLLTDRAFAGADTWATAYTIAMGVKKIGDFDIIIAGKQATDGDTGQVGPGVAAQLGIPVITYVVKIDEIDPEKKTIKVRRLVEAGEEVVESTLPCLITVVKGINVPRFSSLIGKRKAKKAEITIWGNDDIGCENEKIGLGGSPTRVAKIFTPEPRSGGEMIPGDPDTAVPMLIEKLAGDGIL
jgi:electron transfer flavoprotein beta subunit